MFLYLIYQVTVLDKLKTDMTDKHILPDEQLSIINPNKYISMMLQLPHLLIGYTPVLLSVTLRSTYFCYC